MTVVTFPALRAAAAAGLLALSLAGCGATPTAASGSLGASAPQAGGVAAMGFACDRTRPGHQRYCK
jgi:hypothetical protein